MQKLEVVSELPTTVEAAWELFESERFRQALQEKNGTTAHLISERDDGGVIERRLKYELGFELPGFVASALGSKRLAYEQVNRLDLANGRMTWQVTLPGVGDRAKVSGVTTMVPSAGGCTRTVEGTIEVKVPLIGGRVEKAVAAKFRESMTEVVALAKTMI